MTTFEKVKKIVADKLGVDEAKVTETAAFVNDLGADSLDVVEFVMEVEKEFDITIPDEEAAKLATVGDAVKYIESHFLRQSRPFGKQIRSQSQSVTLYIHTHSSQYCRKHIQHRKFSVRVPHR